MASCAERAWATGDDLFAHVDDIDAGTILSIPLAGGILSLIMTFVLAFFRVLNKPKCSKESAEHLQQLKQEMEEKSKHWENQPEQKLEKEREIATHILSISDSIKDGAISFLSTEYFYMAFLLYLCFLLLVEPLENGKTLLHPSSSGPFFLLVVVG